MPEELAPAPAELPLPADSERATSFQNAITHAMANQPATPAEHRNLRYDPGSLGEADQLLQEQGVNLPPLAAPSARDLKKFSAEDWQAVRESTDPLLKLWSARYVHDVQNTYEHHGHSAHHIERTPERRMHETALVRSLPVIQRTSLEALDGAITDGVFRSNRARLAADAGISTGAGHTLGDDQALGLDNYVYADYARPSSIRFDSEVAVVFEPEVMQQPGTFLTEKDIRDYDLIDRENEDVKDMGSAKDPSYRKYMHGAVLPEDLQQVAVPKILATPSFRSHYSGKGLGTTSEPMELEDFVAGSDSSPNNLGKAQFSTWEVKIPSGVSTSGIRKLVFTTEKGRQNFVAKFGDVIPCAVASPEDLDVNPKPGDKQTIDERYKRNMELYGTQERYEQELAKLRAEDYAQRQAAVNASEDKGEGYMLIHHPAPDAPDAANYNPRSHAVSSRVFANREDAVLMAQRDYDPGGIHAEKAAFGEEVQVMRNGVLQWEKAQRREIQIHTPTVTVARVHHSPEAAVITDLSVEDISNPEQ